MQRKRKINSGAKAAELIRMFDELLFMNII